MKKILILLLICNVLPALFAEDMAPLTMPATRSLGMGGPHVAYTDNVYALFVNPAALQKANQGSIFEVSSALIGPVIDLTSKLISLSTTSDEDAFINSMSDFAKDSAGKIPVGIELRGPLSLAYTANGLGFGLWDRVHMDVKIIGTDANVSVLADMIANFGMSFGILSLGNHEVDAGFVVKPFLRQKIDSSISALDLLGGNSDMGDKFSVPLMVGAGLDLGFMYRFHRDLAAGLTIDDVFTRGGRVASFGENEGASSYRAPATLNMGVAYTLRPPLSWLNNASFMLDYRDVTNIFFSSDYTRKNPILNLALGTEVGLFNFLKLRLGLNEMLPAVGIGLEAKAFQFNFAMYGKELSNEPGGFSTYGLDLSIAVRPQTKKKTWPWNKHPLVNSILKSEPSSPEPDRSAELEAEAEVETEAEAAAAIEVKAEVEAEVEVGAEAEAEAAAAEALEQL
jgi:hypothetical protein